MSQASQHATPPDIWWAIPDVLAGMSMPFIHPERHEALGAALHDFRDELPVLWDAGIRGIVCLLNMPGISHTYAAAGFDALVLPLNNGAAPTIEQFQQFLTFVASERTLNHPVAVHCEAGIVGPASSWRDTS